MSELVECECEWFVVSKPIELMTLDKVAEVLDGEVHCQELSIKCAVTGFVSAISCHPSPICCPTARSVKCIDTGYESQHMAVPLTILSHMITSSVLYIALQS